MVVLPVVLSVIFTSIIAVHSQHVNTQDIMESVLMNVLKHQSQTKKQSFIHNDVFRKFLSLNSKTLLNQQSPPTSFLECVAGLNPQSPYFTKYLDSLAKPPTGLFEGNLGWLGNYEECMSIPNAHYCDMKNVAVYNHMFPLSAYGVCVPEKCSIYDVTFILNTTANTLKKFLAVRNITIDIISVSTPNPDNQPTNPLVPPQVSRCLKRPSSRSYTDGAIVMIVISSILLSLCFVGSTLDLVLNFINNIKKSSTNYAEFTDNGFQSKTNSKQNNMNYWKDDKEPNKYFNFFLCFSIIKNTKSIFNTDMPSGAIASINGIRTFSIMWVILGHLMLLGLSTDNPLVLVNDWLKRFSFQGIANATVSVDTFFVLSGTLVGYLSFKRYETHGKLPLFRYYFHRIIRLTPSYAYLIFFVVYLLPYMGDGPTWTMDIEPNCKKYWWTNLLYINNIYPETQDVCYSVSWYLANDMQFYVISPLLMWIMYRFRKIGVVSVLGIALLETMLSNGLLMHYKEATPIFVNGDNLFQPTSKFTALNYQTNIYFKPWTRFGPYVIGIVLGYILFYKKKINSKFSTIAHLIGWIVAAGSAIAIVYGPYSSIEYHVWNESQILIYGILFRIVWAFVICWVIYACYNGYGSIIGDFLGWKAFIPLSRLTYGVYLIHFYVIMYFYSSSKITFHLSEINITFAYISTVFISYCLSYIVAVCIDYPVFNLEKLFLKH